jgi:hypothetical protein
LFGAAILVSDAAKPSKLLLDECYAAEDDRFVEEFKKFDSYKFLGEFVEKWVRDSRPWARGQIVRYLHSELNCPGHELVLKRLFKHFEGERDHEMMAHFMVVLDRLVRRIRRITYSYDWRSRRSSSTEQLFAKPNKTIRNQTDRTENYQDRRGGEQTLPLPDQRNRPENRLFTHKTRNYLRRRVWRYFRQLSYTKPMTYVAYIAAALCQYEDADFEAGENILDNWALMHACYFHHRAVAFGPAHANPAKGRALAELTPSPYQLSAWQTAKGSLALIELIGDAKSSLVRLWAMALLQREHQDAINSIEIRTLLRLLSHIDPRVQAWAVELFQEHASLATLPIETWLELLDQSNLAVLTLVCDAMQEHVSAERLDNEQMISLACARPVPVARMGFDMLRQRHDQRPFSRDELTQISTCQCESIAGEIAAWALDVIGTQANYDLNCVTEFFDAFQRPTREAALDWIQRADSLGFNDPALWARLIETPFDDVKLRLVECLDSRQTHAGQQQTEDISQLWTAVILGVHRGGRTKLKAIVQVADSIAADPSQSDSLLPVLAVAVRSIRAPERLQALSAIATMVARNPEIGEPLARHLPEMQWIEETAEPTT